MQNADPSQPRRKVNVDFNVICHRRPPATAANACVSAAFRMRWRVLPHLGLGPRALPFRRPPKGPFKCCEKTEKQRPWMLLSGLFRPQAATPHFQSGVTPVARKIHASDECETTAGYAWRRKGNYRARRIPAPPALAEKSPPKLCFGSDQGPCAASLMMTRSAFSRRLSDQSDGRFKFSFPDFVAHRFAVSANG